MTIAEPIIQVWVWRIWSRVSFIYLCDWSAISLV